VLGDLGQHLFEVVDFVGVVVLARQIL
jgi:hypothetical protein